MEEKLKNDVVLCVCIFVRCEFRATTTASWTLYAIQVHFISIRFSHVITFGADGSFLTWLTREWLYHHIIVGNNIKYCHAVCTWTRIVLFLVCACTWSILSRSIIINDVKNWILNLCRMREKRIQDIESKKEKKTCAHVSVKFKVIKQNRNNNCTESNRLGKSESFFSVVVSFF